MRQDKRRHRMENLSLQMTLWDQTSSSKLQALVSMQSLRDCELVVQLRYKCTVLNTGTFISHNLGCLTHTLVRSPCNLFRISATLLNVRELELRDLQPQCGSVIAMYACVLILVHFWKTGDSSCACFHEMRGKWDVSVSRIISPVT
jgi:hypothetical protein